MRQVDFLVIGSGIAGLSFALKAAKYGKVLIVTKSNEDESNTKYAQGGVAVVVDESDSFALHNQLVINTIPIRCKGIGNNSFNCLV